VTAAPVIEHEYRRARDPAASPPFVTIIVPTLNEEDYIESCLDSLVGQYPEDAHEILVVDGGSSDATACIVTSFGERHRSVRLLDNPRRLQSSAMNLAARAAAPGATILVRADAHARYAPDFIKSCVSALTGTGATSVVVPMRTEARPGAGLQHAIAAAQSSRLGNGGAAHRTGIVSGFVDHGHHAAFDRAFFQSVGGYDERFTHNEDAELDIRAIKAGGAVWMCADAPVIYYPRDRLDHLARQYFRHGSGRARTLRKHRIRPRPRQLIPVVVLAGCTAGVAMAPFIPDVAALALLYPAACLAWGIAQSVRRRDVRMIAGAAALMTMHLSWASGFVRGFARPFADARPFTDALPLADSGPFQDAQGDRFADPPPSPDQDRHDDRMQRLRPMQRRTASGVEDDHAPA
jgi:succinoglycan biosynthesis protein ExoA